MDIDGLSSQQKTPLTETNTVFKNGLSRTTVCFVQLPYIHIHVSKLDIQSNCENENEIAILSFAFKNKAIV